MACFVNVISIIFLSFAGVVMGDKELEIDKDENIEPFLLLCRMYNVAKNPPINHVDLKEPVEIVQEIDSLNASLGEEKLVNETERDASIVGANINPAATKETAVTQLSLDQITQKAHKILEDIKKINVTREIEKVKAEFSQVIFGENGNESVLEQTVLNGVGDRAVACGNTGQGSKGNSAGKNLVVDFFCLCARRADEDGVNQVCGFYVGVKNSKIGWNSSDPMGSSTMWASIKGGCGKHMQQHPKSTAEARHILDQFLKHLKTGGVYRQIKCESDCPPRKKSVIIVSGSDRKAGMLGTGITINGSTDVSCDGKEGGKKGTSGGPSPGGVCVYYGPESKSWEDNILWLKKLRTALASVKSANNQTATVQRNIKKLQMLLHRAEEIYETAKVITEVQKPVGIPEALQNASGNLTAYNAIRICSYGYSPYPYFISPWVLLLL